MDPCLVCRKVEVVASAAVFVGAVVLESDSRQLCRQRECAESECLCVQGCYFSESVAVVVVAVALAVLPVDEHAEFSFAAHYGCVEGGVVVEGSAYADGCESVCHGSAVLGGVLGDYVYGASYGRRAEQGRAASAHHFHAVDHVCRNLFEAVDTRKGGKHRARVHEYLRVVSVEAVDAHLGETAVLAVVLDAHAGLEIESVGKRACAHEVESLGRNHIDERGAVAALEFAFCACDYDLVEHHRVGAQFDGRGVGAAVEA